MGADAEALAWDATQRRWLVAFERSHRLVSYDTLGGPGRGHAPPPRPRGIDPNKGLEALAVLGAPMIVKPAREGSSIGLTKVTDVAQCAAAYAAAYAAQAAAYAATYATYAAHAAAQAATAAKTATGTRCPGRHLDSLVGWLLTPMRLRRSLWE